MPTLTSSQTPFQSAKRTPSPASSSSSIDLLAPRISFSKEFTKPEARSVFHDTMKEISEFTESPARLSSSKSSPSEFEFAMSFQGQDSSYEHTMLAADELFYDGKLRPLYNAPQGGTPTAEEPVIARRRSSAEEYVMQVHAHELSRVKVDPNPISPKAPTCTSRWRELLGLKKVQIQDASNGSKSHRKAANGLTPGRRSVDSLKDPKASLHRTEVRIPYYAREPKPSLQEAHSHHRVREAKHNMPHSEAHAQYAKNHYDSTLNSSIAVQSELPLLSTADPGICPTTNLQAWQLDRGMSGSRSSKSSEDAEEMVIDTSHLQSNGGEQAAMAKHRSTAKSPNKQTEQTRISTPTMSPRRGAAGSKGMSPARPSVTNRTTESSRSAMTTRLVVRGLDRSYSNPKPIKKRPEQLRSGRQRTSTEGSRSLERSPSYSAGVRVTPVINVPIYITPGLRKGSKNGIFSLTHLFTSKKDKTPNNKLPSSAFHRHPHPDSGS